VQRLFSPGRLLVPEGQSSHGGCSIGMPTWTNAPVPSCLPEAAYLRSSQPRARAPARWAALTRIAVPQGKNNRPALIPAG
jgi:hypothetical protein